MMKRVPILPTLLVLIAAGIMVRLGFWQIDRLHQKEAMLAHYAAGEGDRAVHRWPSAVPPVGYTRLQLDCRPTGPSAPQAGRNASGRSGWAHVVDCVVPDGSHARVVLGWSFNPQSVTWPGGSLTGTYVPKSDGMVVVADPPLAGLEANAKPDPRDIPNNHFAYAVQWFLFAGVALVIYALALRKRWRE
ncbi:MAG: hypothetical protein RIS94_2640 [Pseudomonadota bacterium]|jgi:surfeit locus 1 family protein